ncbi:MAG: DUF4349 domain-containing protein [Anaerolineae bacterium]|nr:DUF4349 domain-containing protein [Anaerolineae bacterium]
MRAPVISLLCLCLVACQPACRLPDQPLPSQPPSHLVATNAQVHLSATDAGTVAADIIQHVIDLGGCVEDNSDDGATRRLELRLPADHFETLMPFLLQGGWEVSYVNVWGQELSDQYATMHDEALALQAALPNQPWLQRFATRRRISDLQDEMAYRLQRAAWATVVVHIQ